MVDYSQGKIYKIHSKLDYTLPIFIGSTCQSLVMRLGGCKASYKHKKSEDNVLFHLIDRVGLDNIQITLIENFPCQNKDELNKREREWIEQTECINKNELPKAKQSQEKTLVMHYNKKWYEMHKDYHKQRYAKNKEMILEKQKNYYEKNKDKILDYKKKHREGKKDSKIIT